MRRQTLADTFFETQRSPSILPIQAYKPFHRQVRLDSNTTGGTGGPRHRTIQSQEAASWRDLVEKRDFGTYKGRPRPLAGRERSTAFTAKESQGNSAIWRSISALPRMSMHQKVALAETQGFLRAKVAAKEQLCSQVIGENQQLLRQLEESQARHRHAIDRIKAEASAVVQHLLADTAVYRDTHENLLHKLKLQERQATNDALRAQHAERHRQEAEEKLLVLKRFVAGLQEKQRNLEEEAHAFATAFRNVKSAIQTFAAGLAACNFSEDDKSSHEQLPEMVSLGINRMKLMLSDTEARLLEKGFVKDVSPKRILQTITGEKPSTMVPATEASRLQRERKMWENKYVRVEKELRTKVKELEEVKKENSRKANVLLKLRLKEHRCKEQEAEFALAKAKTRELQSQLEKLRKERDELYDWKASHPVYKGYRWGSAGDAKSRPASRSPAKADAFAKKSKGFVDSISKLLQPQEQSNVSGGARLARVSSRDSIASSRRVASVVSVASPTDKPKASHSAPQLEKTKAQTVSPMAAKSTSAPVFLGATDGELGPGSWRPSRGSLEDTGMTLLRREGRSTTPAADTRKKSQGLSAGSPTLQLTRGRSLTPVGESKTPSRAPSAGDLYHPLTLELPSSPTAIASAADPQLGTRAPATSETKAEDHNRLADFFNTAFSKAAAKEREGLGQPTQQVQQAGKVMPSPRKGRSDLRASSSHIRRVGSVSSIKTLASARRRVHIDLQRATEGSSPEQGPPMTADGELLSPKSHLARAQAIAFIEGGSQTKSQRGEVVHSVTALRPSRMQSFASETPMRTLHSPSAKAAAATQTTQTAPAAATNHPTSTYDKEVAVDVFQATAGAHGVQQQRAQATAGGHKEQQQRTSQKLEKDDMSVGETASAKRATIGKSAGTSAATREPAAGFISGTSKDGAGNKPVEGSNRSVEVSQYSQLPKEGAFPRQSKGGAVTAAATTMDLEGLLEKYLGDSTKEDTGATNLRPMRGRGEEPEDKRGSNVAPQDHSMDEDDAWRQRKPRPLPPERKTQDGRTPGGDVQEPILVPRETKPEKRDSLERLSSSVEPATAALPSQPSSTVDQGTNSQPIVRLGTRAKKDGEPSRLITGIRKAPPKLMDKNKAVEPTTEALAPSRLSAASLGNGSAAETSAAPASAPSLSKAPSLSSDRLAPNPPPPRTSAEGSLGHRSGIVTHEEDGTAPDLGQPRKRMSTSDTAAGSWSMAAPKLNISAMKAPKHEKRREEGQ